LLSSVILSYILVISASVPTKENLSTVDEIKFPDPSRQMISALETQAQIIIPNVVFSMQGTTKLYSKDVYACTVI